MTKERLISFGIRLAALWLGISYWGLATMLEFSDAGIAYVYLGAGTVFILGAYLLRQVALQKGEESLVKQMSDWLGAGVMILLTLFIMTRVGFMYGPLEGTLKFVYLIPIIGALVILLLTSVTYIQISKK
jgi:hypothetical protein